MDRVWTRGSLHSSKEWSFSDELKNGFEIDALAEDYINTLSCFPLSGLFGPIHHEMNNFSWAHLQALGGNSSLRLGLWG